jgi:two-component system, NtrC family, sensor kinase
METAAQAVCDLLYERLVDEDGNPACALVRLYKTHPYGNLEPDLQAFAVELAGRPLDSDVRCLTLLGTRGLLDEWSARRLSRGHKTIPLVSADAVARLPMVISLITELGLDVETVLRPPERDASLADRTYDVFHVPEALGSPHLPAQDFVAAHGIRSAVGFGGVLFSGDFYAVVLFSRVPIDERTAQRLKILSLPVRVPLIRFTHRHVFAKVAGGASAAG